MRVPRVIVDPKNPLSIVEHVSRVQRVVDELIEFGDPQDPNNPQSTTPANGAAHNGTQSNIRGSWVEVTLNSTTLRNTNVACTHNLGVQLLSASQPNVRWLLFGWQHSGLGTLAGTSVSVIYTDGAVTSDSIQLRFYAGGMTVNDANPLKVTLFFIPAVRGIAQP